MAKTLVLLSACLALLELTNGLIETCQDMQDAVDSLQSTGGDVTVDMFPFANIECDNFTTFTIDTHHLTIESSEDLDIYSGGNTDLFQVRFEVINGGELTYEPNVEFLGVDLQNVDGGAVYVGEGSRVRFLNDFGTEGVGVRSIADLGDFSSYQLSGGCVWTNGYFRVGGLATMNDCEVGGGGESSPGPGGAVFVGEEGLVVFQGGVEISDVSIIDDEGNDGGGIYNTGKVIVKGKSKFESLFAESAGAIFNAEGASFKFKEGATAIFTECRSFDGIGGAILNEGVFEFSGAALFLDGRSDRGGAIVVQDTGEMVLSEDSVFFENESSDDIGAPVYVFSGGSLTVPESLLFIGNGNEDAVCDTIYFEDGAVCI